MAAELVALVGGLASALAVVATSMRKRLDVDVDEMRSRVSDLTERLTSAEKELGQLRAELVKAEGRIFALTRLLAAHGIDEPSGATT